MVTAKSECGSRESLNAHGVFVPMRHVILSAQSAGLFTCCYGATHVQATASTPGKEFSALRV